MVGYSSIQSLTAVLALHATISTPYNTIIVVAGEEEEEASVNGGAASITNKPQKKQRRRLRRNRLLNAVVGSSTDKEEEALRSSSSSSSSSERLKDILVESNAIFLHPDITSSYDEPQPRTLRSIPPPLGQAVNSRDDISRVGCSHRLWHPDLASPSMTCSNALNGHYPHSWEDDLEIHGVVMFGEAEDCCAALLEVMGGDDYGGGGCAVINDCSSSSSSVSSSADDKATASSTVASSDSMEQLAQNRRTTCISKGWHTSLSTRDGCSNDDNYPPEWAESEQISRNMFFPTSSECCARLYSGRECKVYDGGCQIEGAPTTTTLPLSTDPIPPPPSSYSKLPILAQKEDAGLPCAWHPTLNSGGVSGCSYSKEYPAAWNNAEWRHQFLYDDHPSCCAGAFTLSDCAKTFVCATEKPTGMPTKMREVQTTPPPTPATPQPTFAPTSIWFIDHFTGVCKDAAIYFKPHYIPETYPQLEACCEKSFAGYDTCMSDAYVYMPDTDDGTDDDIGGGTPSPTIETYMPTYSPTVTIYYMEHFTGMCVNTVDVPMPFYVEKNETLHFNEYRDCCKSSFKREQCLDEGPPAPEPTGYPTEWRSPDPTLSPSYLPSGMPSLPTMRPTVEDCEDSKWRYDTDYVNGCTNLALLEEDDEGGGSGELLYQNWEECCQIFFGRGRDCQVDDRCRTNTTIITFETRPRKKADYCETSSPKYHPDMEHMDGCTNSLDYPDSWLEIEDQSNLFFMTAAQCCEAVYLNKGYSCNVRNVCAVDTDGPPTHSPTKVTSIARAPNCNVWHPDTDPQVDGCSNAADIPDEWNDPPWSEPMLFNSSQLCCDAHYTLYGLECNVNNTCPEDLPSDYDGASSSECDSAKWHPRQMTTEAACSNSLDYNEAWNRPGLASQLLFDNFTECCIKHFPEDWQQSCRMDYECVEPSTTGSTIASAITASTVFSHCNVWHPTSDYSKCTNEEDYPSSWEGSSDALLFNDAITCCENIFNYPGCPTENVCEDAVTTPRPSPSPTTPEPSAAKISPSSAPSADESNNNTLGDGGDGGDGPTINPCSWRTTKSQCKIRLCVWDTSTLSCVMLGEQSLNEMMTPSPSTNAPTPALIDDASNTNRCGGKSTKRQCANDPGCGWDTSQLLCVEDTTSTATVADDNNDCEGKEYHPRTALDRTCSNDEKYPKTWNEPIERAKYFFTSADKCCAAYYNDGTCNIDNICSTNNNNEPVTSDGEDCLERKWHPLTAKNRICTNAPDYPPLWDTPLHSEEYLLGSAAECCEAFYSDGSCTKRDVCDV